MDVRVIRHVDDGLVCPAHELGLVLDGEDADFPSLGRRLRSGCVDDACIHIAWEAFIAILAPQGELHALPTAEFSPLKSWDLPAPNWRRTIPETLSPALDAAV